MEIDTLEDVLFCLLFNIVEAGVLLIDVEGERSDALLGLLRTSPVVLLSAEGIGGVRRVEDRNAFTDGDDCFVGVAFNSSLSTDRREAVGVRNDGLRGALDDDDATFSSLTLVEAFPFPLFVDPGRGGVLFGVGGGRTSKDCEVCRRRVEFGNALVVLLIIVPIDRLELSWMEPLAVFGLEGPPECRL